MNSFFVVTVVVFHSGAVNAAVIMASMNDYFSSII